MGLLIDPDPKHRDRCDCRFSSFQARPDRIDEKALIDFLREMKEAEQRAKRIGVLFGRFALKKRGSTGFDEISFIYKGDLFFQGHLWQSGELANLSPGHCLVVGGL